MTIGIAVIGAGMAGKAHAAAYRVAPTLYDSTLPDLRYVSICDVNPEISQATARRYGYERGDTDWRAIAGDPGIDVVSVVIANSLHLEVVKGLLEAGKHVLCEKPLSDTLDSAREMARLAQEASTLARIGLTYQRQPGIAAIRDWIRDGTLGRVPLLVRLRLRPDGADQLAIQGTDGIGSACRRWKSPDVSRRVLVRRGHGRLRRGLHHRRRRTPSPAGQCDRA